MAREDTPYKLGSTWKASAVLTGYQFRVMRQDAALTCTYASTAGSGGIGILYNEPDTIGKGCAIVVGGVCPVEAGASFAQGALLTNDNVGRLITATPGDEVVARAAEAAGAAGEIVGAKVLTAGSDVDYLIEHACETPIQTAAFGAAVVDTWEDYALITAINTAATGSILTGERVQLTGVMEMINADGAAARNFKYANGGTPDNDDTVVSYEIPAASTSYEEVVFITDASGQIKVETVDQADLTAVFHLKSWKYVHPTAFV